MIAKLRVSLAGKVFIDYHRESDRFVRVGQQSESEGLVQLARGIVEKAENVGIPLRVLGACAFRIHCKNFNHLFGDLDRPITDIDFASLRNYSNKLLDFFQKLGYNPNQRIIGFYGRTRHVYYAPNDSLQIDVFMDGLEMCHTIDLRSRLFVDKPTIPPADLLLEKLQIVKINEKDLKDMLVLFREHDVSDSDVDAINSSYITKLLSNDWGFYYTAMMNLGKLGSYMSSFAKFSESDRADVMKKISELQRDLQNAPKSMKWKFRAKIGTSKTWYHEVEDLRGISGKS